MNAAIVVENPSRWPLEVPGATVVSARDYLTDPSWASRRGQRVYNFCRTYTAQTLGYYVSLLAEARGHRPFPTVSTLQDLRLSPVVRIVSEQLDAAIQKSFQRLKARRFELSIYFGHNLARGHDALARALYQQFRAPLLRATFERQKRWELTGLRLLAMNEVPDDHRPFIIERIQHHLAHGEPRPSSRVEARYDMAILQDPDAADAPSDAKALSRFVRAAQKVGIAASLIGREDYGDIAEFDALFIRETTAVDHHTYRFARRAAAEGLVVVDDPVSIVRCTNKVYQAELFAQNAIACPRTMIAHSGNVDLIPEVLGLPCMLKAPDSSFSRGVTKAEDTADLAAKLGALFEESDLVVAQAFTPSAFDWRIGILGGKVLFACRYHMARGHWAIAAEGPSGRRRFGRVEPVAVSDTPAGAIDVALRAAALIGDGFYGVDVKEVEGRFLVMEVNDNPNVDADCEDGILREGLYLAIMGWFRDQLEARGRGPAPRV